MMKKLSDKHVSLTLSSEVQQIIKQYELEKNYGIKHFHYIRGYYKDRSYTTLTNNPTWHKYIVESEIPESFPVYDYKHGIYLWGDMYPAKVCNEANDFCDIHIASDIIYVADNYFELYSFGASKNSICRQSTFLNIIDRLVGHIQDFQKKSLRLFLMSDKNRLIAPWAIVENNSENLCIKHGCRHAFLEGLAGFNFGRQKQKKVKLTKQEWRCIKYESYGMSAKEIAKKMEISPKTVETHWGNVGNKTGCAARSERINLLQQYYENNIPYLDRDK